MFRFLLNLIKGLIIFLIINVGTLCSSNLCAQNIATDSLQSKLSRYNSLYSKQILFINTDKTVYTNNETIWFAGFILQNAEGKNITADILSVSLVQTGTKQIFMQKYYLLKDNLCAGSLLLPDSIAPGNYELVAFTNLIDRNGKPLGAFRQELTIKSNKVAPFFTNFKIADTLLETGPGIGINISAALPDASPLKNAAINYNLQGQKSKLLKLDAYGKGLILIPKAALNPSNNNILFTSTQYNEHKQYFNLQLPQQKKDSIYLKFYPEGGYLIEGLKSRIIIEAKTASGSTVQLKALLLSDGGITDTLKTNNYGVCTFSILPKANTHYAVRLLDNDKNIHAAEFMLPHAIKKGIVVEIRDAVTNDTLLVSLKSSIKKQSVRVAISNTSTGYVSEPIVIYSEKKLTLPLNNILKGINVLTVLDSLNRPLAERLFFAHFDQKNDAGIKTDKPVYKTKEKVNVSIQLTDKNKSPVGGIFSIACVQTNRIDYGKQKDIASYYYLGQLFSSLPAYRLKKTFENKAALEYLLLLQGWRRYTWQNIMQAPITDTLQPVRKLELSGQVYRSNEILKKTVELIIKKDSTLVVMNTNANGYFPLNPNEIAVPENRSVFAMVSGKSNSGYQIITKDPIQQFIQRQITGFRFEPAATPPALQNSKQLLLQDFDKVNMLAEVVIKAKTSPYAASQGIYPVNECGDYVCYLNILNCPIHPPASLPVKGQKYYVPGRGVVTYEGCLIEGQQGMSKIGSVYTAREFYGMDSTALQQNTPEYMSTIFWKAFNITNKDGKIDFSFYTSDIKGPFTITVQGVATNGDFLYQEKNITVKNNP